MSYNTEKIREIIEAILNALKSVEQPTSDKTKITEWKKQNRELSGKLRVYTLKVDLVDPEIKKCNSKLLRKLTKRNEFIRELNYRKPDNNQQIENLNQALGCEIDTPVCMEPEHDLSELERNIESISADIKSINARLEHLTRVKQALDIEYTGVESTIQRLNKLIDDEESEPSRFKNNLDLELRRFTRLLEMLKMYDQYIVYAKTHKLGTECYQYKKIEYLPNLESLIAPDVDTSDLKLVIEFESYVNHLVSTCNEHHYYKLLETYVCACPSSHDECDTHSRSNTYDYPEFHAEYPNGGYKPGAAECSHDYKCEWAQVENYGIGKSNIVFDDTGRMAFTIFSEVPPGHSRYHYP
jgi:hypothetical protein